MFVQIDAGNDAVVVGVEIKQIEFVDASERESDDVVRLTVD